MNPYNRLAYSGLGTGVPGYGYGGVNRLAYSGLGGLGAYGGLYGNRLAYSGLGGYGGVGVGGLYGSTLGSTALTSSALAV